MQTWLSELHYRMAKYRPALRTTQGKSYYVIFIRHIETKTEEFALVFEKNMKYSV